MGDRFGPRPTPPWPRIEARSERIGSCLIYVGRGQRTRRNRYAVVSDGRGGSISAHRAAYEHHYGPIPAGMHVLHRCDDPWCVEKEHLFLGTQAENMADMASKGRGRKARAWSR